MTLEARRNLVARPAVGAGVGHAGVFGWTGQTEEREGLTWCPGRIRTRIRRRSTAFTDLAVLARVSVGAVAVVLVRLRVLTRGAVLAGLVGAAVVQICVKHSRVSGGRLRKLPMLGSFVF